MSGKYIKYAIGEIFLVMIGILLAIQVNNWNEDRKARAALNIKLESLIHSLETDRRMLINFEESVVFKITSLQHLLKLSGIPEVILNEHFLKIDSLIAPVNGPHWEWKGPYPDTLNREFIKMAFKESGISRFTGLNAEVYNELKSTGLLSNIENDTLPGELFGYYELFDQEYNERYFNAINEWRKTLQEHGTLFFDMRQIQDPIQFISESPKISADIKALIYDSAWIEVLLHSRISRIDNLITKIREEMD